jgi:hypothetical protein
MHRVQNSKALDKAPPFAVSRASLLSQPMYTKDAPPPPFPFITHRDGSSPYSLSVPCFSTQNVLGCQALVTHACNPSYLGG